MKHRHILLSEEMKQKCQLNETEIAAAATLPELDEAYTRRVHNFKTVKDMYKWSSSINYFDGIEKPMVFINSKDDPLIHENLLHPIKEFCGEFYFFLKIYIHCFRIVSRSLGTSQGLLESHSFSLCVIEITKSTGVSGILVRLCDETWKLFFSLIRIFLNLLISFLKKLN